MYSIIKYINKSLKIKIKLKKLLNMKLKNYDIFWLEFIENKNTKYPFPNFISGYKSLKIHGFTQQVLKSLVQENLIRSKINNKEETNYAEQDILLFKKIRTFITAAKERDIIKKLVVNDNHNQYGILKKFIKGKSYDKYQAELFLQAIDFFRDLSL